MNIARKKRFHHIEEKHS